MLVDSTASPFWRLILEQNDHRDISRICWEKVDLVRKKFETLAELYI